jgi:hypothetical protein
MIIAESTRLVGCDFCWFDFKKGKEAKYFP